MTRMPCVAAPFRAPVAADMGGARVSTITGLSTDVPACELPRIWGGACQYCSNFASESGLNLCHRVPKIMANAVQNMVTPTADIILNPSSSSA